jgi:hypothetical protein
VTGQGLASYPQGERHSSYTVIESILPGSQPALQWGQLAKGEAMSSVPRTQGRQLAHNTNHERWIR